MKIPRRVVLAKKVRSIESKPAPDVGFKLRCLQVLTNLPERAQVVSSVKVVNPSVILFLSVNPRAVLVLLTRRVTSDSQRWIEKFCFARELINTAQERCAKKIRIVDSPTRRRERITEACVGA